MYLNNQQLIDVGTKLNCKYDDIAKVLKTSLLGEAKGSRYFREIFGEVVSLQDTKKEVIEEYLRSTEVGVILMQRSEVANKPVFTPKSS